MTYEANCLLPTQYICIQRQVRIVKVRQVKIEGEMHGSLSRTNSSKLLANYFAHDRSYPLS